MLKANGAIKDSRFEGPLFIFGVARSGTSYLLRLVNSLPHTRLAFESEIIQPAYNIYIKKDVLVDLETFKEYLEHLKRIDIGTCSRPRTPLFVQKDTFYQDLYNNFLQHRDLRKFIRDLYRAGNKNTLIWGDKTAEVDQLPTIIDLFPDARFIFIIRDVRDMVSSYSKHSQVNYYTPCFLWVKIARLAKELQGKTGKKVMVVRYEDMVLQTMEIYDRIASFLDIVPETFSVADQAFASSIGNWRSQLKPNEIQRIEEICFDEMTLYGYKKEYAAQPRKINMFFFGLVLLQNAFALLKGRRSTLQRVFSRRAIAKYIRLYCKW